MKQNFIRNKAVNILLLMLVLLSQSVVAQVEGLGVSETQDLYEIFHRLEKESTFAKASKGDNEELLKEVITNMCKKRLKRYLHMVPEELPEEKKELQDELNKILSKVASLPNNQADLSSLFESFFNEGMLSVDPYFEYRSAQTVKRNKKLNTQVPGTLGIELDYREGHFYLTPLAGLSAETAGIKSGDRLIAIDKVSLEGRTFQNVVSLLRGRINSKVELKIRNKEGQKFISVTRAAGEILRNTIDPIGNRIVIQNLDTTFVKDLRSKANRFNSDELIIDLTDCMGGSLRVMNEFCELFLQPGELVRWEKGSYLTKVKNKEGRVVTLAEKGEKKIKARDKALFNFSSITIIQGKDTASAAEAIITSFKQAKGFKTITEGQKTFGKALITRGANLSSGAQVFYSVKKMYKADGTSWEGIGLTPDKFIE